MLLLGRMCIHYPEWMTYWMRLEKLAISPPSTYLDDILVASKTFETHLRHLREVFSRLRAAFLRLKPKKCGLLRQEVPFLGHVISAQGIHPDPVKTEKVKSYPHATGVRRLLGFASYYRRFVPNFASIAAPLHALTKKNTAFQWARECEEAFMELKKLLTTTPVLAYPKFGPAKRPWWASSSRAARSFFGATIHQRPGKARFS